MPESGKTPVALEVVSPEKLLLSRSVEMVVIPAEEGDIGVLGGHAPMIVTLRGGFTTLYEGGHAGEKFFVAGGFAEITPERCTVLAGEIYRPGEVSKAAAEKRLADAEATWQAVDKMNVALRDASLASLQIARAMLAAADAA